MARHRIKRATFHLTDDLSFSGCGIPVGTDVTLMATKDADFLMELLDAARAVAAWHLTRPCGGDEQIRTVLAKIDKKKRPR